jgi:hypothetical protein
LPRLLRFAVLMCALFSSVVGLFGASASLGGMNRLSGEDRPSADATLSEKTAYEVAQVWDRQGEGFRAMSLAAAALLAAACGLVFVAANLFVRPGLFPREGIRRVLAAGTAGAAVLCTIYGASLAALSQKVAPLYLDLLLSQAPELSRDDLSASLPRAFVLAMGLVTAGFAGLFSLLSAYFGSASVRAVVSARDAELPSS